MITKAKTRKTDTALSRLDAIGRRISAEPKVHNLIFDFDDTLVVHTCNPNAYPAGLKRDKELSVYLKKLHSEGKKLFIASAYVIGQTTSELPSSLFRNTAECAFVNSKTVIDDASARHMKELILRLNNIDPSIFSDIGVFRYDRSRYVELKASLFRRFKAEHDLTPDKTLVVTDTKEEEAAALNLHMKFLAVERAFHVVNGRLVGHTYKTLEDILSPYLQ